MAALAGAQAGKAVSLRPAMGKAPGSRVCGHLPSQPAGAQPSPHAGGVLPSQRYGIACGCCPAEASREVPQWTLPRCCPNAALFSLSAAACPV